MAREQRRLAAIVSADVAGYSRLMSLDESATLEALKAHRRELIDPKISEYNGRIVKTTGDGLLLEFPSVVDAVRCVVDVQRGMVERNAALPADRRIELRIGINLGDIIIDGDDIFGDGVNVAARLQTLAEPGGIFVSKVVRDQVLDKLAFAFEELGERQVKNIARPIDIYRIDLGTGMSSHPAGPAIWRRLSGAPRWRLAASAALAAALIGIGAWRLPSAFAPARSPSPVYSIAVLPFAAASPAEAQTAESISTELASSLARAMPWLTVASTSVSGKYKERSVDMRAVGRELDARYVVGGVVRASGERSDVKTSVIDARSGVELWSDGFELDGGNDAERRRTFMIRLANEIKYVVLDAEHRRVLALPVSDLNAQELTLRAEALSERDLESLTALAEARSLYDRALRLEPNYAEALMSKTYTIARTLDLDRHADRDRLLREYDETSQRVIAVADREARAWNIRADALQRQWHFEAAVEANATAAKLDPTRFGTMDQHADLLVAMGRPEEALAAIDRALALQPPAGSAGWLLLCRCRAELALGRYDDAIADCEKASSVGDSWPGSLSPHVFLLAAYALQGNDAKAQTEKAKVRAKEPRFSIAEFEALRISNVPAYRQQTENHLYAGLRKAGIADN